MNNSNYFWEIILKDLKSKIKPEVFSSMIEPNSIESINMMDRTITIISSNSLISEYIQNFYDTDFKNILKTHTNLDFNIFYTYVNNTNNLTESNKFSTQSTTSTPTTDSSNNLEGSILEMFKSSDDKNLFPKKSNQNESYITPQPVDNFQSNKNTSLKKDFTFDNFVVGDGSKYAFSLAYSTTISPGIEHNPLFIYGGVGLGKTHLLHAIGNELEASYPDFSIQCVTSEKLLNDYVYSVQAGKKHYSEAEKFRKKYREIDALLIDDIQFLYDKPGLQTAFYHIFNDLHREKKQIVLISDRRPDELDGLDDRLVSRFESGIIADITPPDYETRMSIIKFKCDNYGLNLDESVISYIAGNVHGNIRKIEGILKELKFKSDTGSPVSLSLVEETIKHRVKTIKKSIQATDIINITSDFYKISVDDILSAKRNKDVGFARMIAIYLCRDLTELSLPALGKLFNKDHSTIHYANSKITNMILDNENDIVADIEFIKDKLKSL